MFLSVIIPVYNKEKYLRECLDALVNQTYDKCDFEIICIDDGSPDKCGEILDVYASENANMHVIHKKNCGVSTARNDGIDMAKGEYIYFLDADDIVAPNLISVFKSYSDTNPDSISINSYHMQSDKFTDEELQLKERGALQGKESMMWTSCYKKIIIDEYKIRFRHNISIAEDSIFVNDFNHYANSKVSTGITAHFYRNTPGGLLHKAKKEKIDSYIALIEVFKNYLKDRTDNEDWLEYQMYLRVYDSIDAIVRFPVYKWNKYLRKIKALGIWGQKPSEVVCEKFLMKKAEGKPDAVDKNLKSYSLGACRLNVFRLFILYKLNKWFNLKYN